MPGAHLIILLLIVGLVVLVLGADLLVRGASKLALSFGLSPLVVGLTVVAFGTSAPEIAVSVGAVLEGNGGLAVGNVVGSNIMNVLLILGLSAMIVPLRVDAQVVRQEVPIMVGASVLLLAQSLDHELGLFDGIVLFVLQVGYVVFLVRQSRAQNKVTQLGYAHEFPQATGWASKLPVQVALILVGLGGLVLGAELFVSSAVEIAHALGVSDLVIGLTVVAIGTSMPELATSLMAARRGERDIAVGNAVGSNIFNILGCMGLSSLAAGLDGITVPPAALGFDLWIMVAVAIACLPVFLSRHEIARWEGALFVFYYLAYVSFLVLRSQAHASMALFSAAMLGYVLPMTVVTLVVVLIRARLSEPPT